MSKHDKPKEDSTSKKDEFDKSRSPYQKIWPKDDDVEEPSLHEQPLEDAEVVGILEHPSYIELEKKLTKAEELANEYWNQQLRIQAELENVRRRAERDVSQAHKYALEKIVSDLLPVADSLDQALVSEVGSNDLARKIHEGIELTMSLFLKTLEKHGVKQINPLGETFNPELHQAIATRPSDDYEPNTVVEVLQKGYTLNDRLIRPALVVVAQG
jgi:molecular chaperone GrpE